MNSVFCNFRSRLCTPCCYLNLDGFFVLAEEVFDEDDQLGRFTFLVNKVFGWNNQLQEYSFCLFKTSLDVKRPCVGVAQGRILALYQESFDLCTRYLFQFLGSQSPNYSGCFYKVKIEVLMNNNTWETIGEGEYNQYFSGAT